MLGAIIGDIVGSRFEFNNIKSKDFELFDENITDLFEDTLKMLNNGISKLFLGFKTVKNLPKIKENLKKLSFFLAKITKE